MDGDSDLDPVAVLVEAKGRRRAVGNLPRLLREAVVLSWSASPVRFATTMLLQVASAALLGLQLWLGKLVVDGLLALDDGRGSMAAAVPALIGLAVVTAVASASGVVAQQQQRVLTELVRREVWRRLFHVTVSVELNQFETQAFNDQLQRVRTSAIVRPLTISQGLVTLVSGGVGIVALTVALVDLSPVLPIVLLLAAVPLWWLSRRGGRVEFDFAVSQAPAARRRDYLAELLTTREAAKEVRAFGTAAELRRRYELSYAGYVDDLVAHVRRRQRMSLASSAAAAAAAAAALAVLLWLIARGDVGLAAGGTAAVAVPLLASRMTSVFSGLGSVLESGLFLEDLDAFLRLAVATEEEGERRDVPRGFDLLEVENLSFTYPGSDVPAVDDVSMLVRRGEVIALVGENGSGKTTVAKLLARLYQPDAGQIRWDGEDALVFDAGQLRESIAVIFQDFLRYELSAGDNIGLGRPGTSGDAEGIRAAAGRSGADAVVAALPSGYDTLLNRTYVGGRDLSLGQWQRVALARAFYRDAPFVVLDEPSSALDARAEHDLFATIRSMMTNRTVLLISHRFSTVRTADRIYVLHAGRVVEDGTHDELMALDGRYRDMFDLQASSYLDESYPVALLDEDGR